MSSLPSASATPKPARQLGARWCLPGSGMPLMECVSQVGHRAKNDAVTALAGNLAFRLLFAFFPTAISLLWLLTVLHASRVASEVSDLIGMIVPGIANSPV